MAVTSAIITVRIIFSFGWVSKICIITPRISGDHVPLIRSNNALRLISIGGVEVGSAGGGGGLVTGVSIGA